MILELRDGNMVTIDSRSGTSTGGVASAVTPAKSPEPVIKKWRLWKRVGLLLVSTVTLWGLLIFGAMQLFS